MRWRTEADGIPPSFVFINSPCDLDARYAQKETTQWVGYKVHLTESCDDDFPQLITNVETTAGPIADAQVTLRIHAALKSRDILPNAHIVDTGFIDARLLVESRSEYDVDLFGPTRHDYHWQARWKRLRCGALPYRLGSRTGYLSNWTHKPELDTGHRQAQERGH